MSQFNGPVGGDRHTAHGNQRTDDRILDSPSHHEQLGSRTTGRVMYVEARPLIRREHETRSFNGLQFRRCQFRIFLLLLILTLLLILLGAGGTIQWSRKPDYPCWGSNP